MLQRPNGTPPDVANRLQIALDRIQLLIATAEERAARSTKSYYTLQVLTIALAAITPCLIFLAKDNPKNELLSWLQLFFPAIAATTAGLSHIVHAREDAVRYTTLAESIRSQLWRFQTRTGEFGPTLGDNEVLDRLVTRVDDLNLQTVARWSAEQLTQAQPPSGKTKTAAAAGAEQ